MKMPLIVVLVLLGLSFGQAQTFHTNKAVLSAGGEGSGSVGSISYSIGQVFSHTSNSMHHGVQYTLLGCTHSNACNYNVNATDNDGSCEFSEDFYDCDGLCLNDSDADGICDENEIPGCTDTSALNYDSNATDDDASCVTSIAIYCALSVTGSTKEASNNYGGASPEKIYRFEVTTSGDYEFSTCGSDFDTYLRIYDATMTEIHSGDDDGDCGTQTVLNKSLELGVYYVLVEGYDSHSGFYDLIVTCPCPEGEVVDCHGNCAPETWLSDGYCDDGSYESGGQFIYFNCEAFNNDQGDCESIETTMMHNVEVSMHDSYGDGWNGNRYEIVNSWGFPVAQGELSLGSSSTDHWTLPADCYMMNVGGGTWQEEVSWHVVVSHPDAGTSITQGAIGNAIGNFDVSVESGDCKSDEWNAMMNWGRLDAAPSTQQEEVLELEDALELSAYYDALTHLVSIEAENYGSQKLNYQLYDILGHLIDENQLTGVLTNINMSQFPEAIYMLKINTTENEDLKTFKIIKH